MEEYIIKPAIVVITYNRIKSLKRILGAIENAYYPEDDIPLVISVDYECSSQHDEVVDFARKFEWHHGPKTVRELDSNLGLKEHFFICADFSIEYQAAIIFEDDVFPAPGYYMYTVEALKYYRDEKRIFAIALYSQLWDAYGKRPFEPLRIDADAYVSQIECSWGECHIGDRWIEFRRWYEANKNMTFVPREDIPTQIIRWNDSYSKYIIHYYIDNDKYFLTPYESYSTNFSDAGTHAAMNSTSYQVPLCMGMRTPSFVPFDQAVRYSIFHENLSVQEKIETTLDGKLCLDFPGSRGGYHGYEYCISSRELPFHRIKSYGLQLRPWELNIIYDICGEDIFLYDLKRRKGHKLKLANTSFSVIKYHVRDLSIWMSLKYTVLELIRKGSMVPKKIRKIKKRHFKQGNKEK